MFFVRRNKAASRSIVLNTVRQCSLFAKTRFDHVLCSPKRGHVSLHCTQHACPCLHRNTIDLETRQVEDRPGEKGIREMSRETERTSDSRLKVNDSYLALPYLIYPLHCLAYATRPALNSATHACPRVIQAKFDNGSLTSQKPSRPSPIRGAERRAILLVDVAP